MNDDAWNMDEPVTDLGIDVPAWIEQDISPATVAAILQGGCASGAYMPAVTYHRAAETMAAHGDDVLQYLEDEYGALPAAPAGSSWSGLACRYLSAAVECWAASVEYEIDEAIEAGDEEEDA